MRGSGRAGGGAVANGGAGADGAGGGAVLRIHDPEMETWRLSAETAIGGPSFASDVFGT